MPQLDKFSFFTQIFWLVVLVSIFYFFLVEYFLPNLSSILKLRVKTLKKFKSNLVIYANLFLSSVVFRKKVILSILKRNQNIIINYNYLIEKYTAKFSTKAYRLVRIKPKLDKKKLYEYLKIIQQILPTRKII